MFKYIKLLGITNLSKGFINTLFKVIIPNINNINNSWKNFLYHIIIWKKTLLYITSNIIYIINIMF